MAISVGTYSAVSTSYSAQIKVEKTKAAGDSTASQQKAAGTETAAKEDSVEIKGDGYQVDIDALRKQNEERIQKFKDQLLSMITGQKDKADKSISDVFGVLIEVTEEDRAAAQASIEDGGEWSVNAVADRIMNMAYALSGGDESKLATLKSAVQKGFAEAGFDSSNYSSMPSITGQTYDEIMKRFDEWETTGMKTYDTNGKGTYQVGQSNQAGQTGAAASVTSVSIEVTQKTSVVSGSIFDVTV